MLLLPGLRCAVCLDVKLENKVSAASIACSISTEAPVI